MPQLGKKIAVKVCSIFAVELNWQLKGLFVLISDQKKNYIVGDNVFTERVIGWKIIGNYFHCGYGYKTIVHLLKTYSDIPVSERTLKRRWQKYNLRKNSNTDDSVLRIITRRELLTQSQCLVYRVMLHFLKKSYSIQVPQVRVMQVLWEENPEGTAQRRAQKLVWRDYFSFGSNFCWHCDN